MSAQTLPVIRGQSPEKLSHYAAGPTELTSLRQLVASAKYSHSKEYSEQQLAKIFEATFVLALRFG